MKGLFIPDITSEMFRNECLEGIEALMAEGEIYDIEYDPSAQQWIPWDSGKLPKESGYYTVTAYDGVTKRVTYAKYQKRLKRWELTGATAYWRVVAWCPLPEPWKGDEK